MTKKSEQVPIIRTTDPIIYDVIRTALDAGEESLRNAGEHMDGWTSADIAADIIVVLAEDYGLDLAHLSVFQAQNR